MVISKTYKHVDGFNIVCKITMAEMRFGQFNYKLGKKEEEKKTGLQSNTSVMNKWQARGKNRSNDLQL